MKWYNKISSEDKKAIKESIDLCIYIMCFILSMIFVAFVWLCCHHIEEILEILAKRI